MDLLSQQENNKREREKKYSKALNCKIIYRKKEWASMPKDKIIKIPVIGTLNSKTGKITFN